MFVHGKMQSSSLNDSNPVFDIQQMTNAELTIWVSRFILEVQKNLEEHHPNTLYQMICGLQMYIQETKLSF